MSNKLQAKDLINLGLFTVLYFVIGCCVAIPIGFVPIFLPILGALWSLITGIPFMLFLTRVNHSKDLHTFLQVARADPPAAVPPRPIVSDEAALRCKKGMFALMETSPLAPWSG